MVARIILIVLLAFPFINSWGQNQLVLFSRQKVLARYSYGDDFVYKLKKSKKYKKGFITEVREFSLITFNDTILFADIDRVRLQGGRRRPGRLSKFLMGAGFGYFILDQANNVIVQGNKPDLPPQIWKPSLVLVTAGYILTWFHKGSQQIRFPAKLMGVPPGSPFYRSND